MLLGDFHIHSNFSDGVLTISEIVDLYGSRGFDVIAITDHLCESESFLGKWAKRLDQTLTPETWPVYLNIIESEGARAMDQYGMLLLSGFEISKNSVSNSRSAHLIGLGVPNFVYADGDVYDIAKSIKEIGGTTIAAHPVWTRVMEKQTFHLWDRRSEMSEVIDAWECTRNFKILEEVTKSRLPVIASSDLHKPNHLSSWKTIVHSEKHPEAVLDAIKNQNLSFKIFNDSNGGSNGNNMCAPILSYI